MKKVVMTPNPYRDRNFKYALQAEKILREVGVETRICLAFDVDRSFALPSNIVLHDLQTELRDAELLICFGGDGTLLHASKAATYAGVPVLGVNIGTMGFMAELEIGELDQLRRLARDEYDIEERMMLHVRAEHEGEIILQENALNDAVITKGAVARIVQMSIASDGVEVMNFGGDGVVVATPTGSTAYSMSAGGPIVEPTTENIIITPLCAHDMWSKVTVTSPHRRITVDIARMGRKTAFLSVDGGRAVRLCGGDRVTITRSDYVTKLVKLSHRAFYDVMKNKFR